MAGIKLENLTFDNKPLKNRSQISFNWSVLYIVEKIFLRVIRYCPHIFKKKLGLIEI